MLLQSLLPYLLLLCAFIATSDSFLHQSAISNNIKLQQISQNVRIKGNHHHHHHRCIHRLNYKNNNGNNTDKKGDDRDYKEFGPIGSFAKNIGR